MKKLLSALSSTLQGGVRGGLLILTLLATTTLWAYDFKSGNLYYNITSKSAPYTVEVTYQSSSYDKNYPTLTTATIPMTVTYNGTIYSVTKIGPRALGGCSTLKSITIPNSIISIDYAAFEACSSLTSITIPGSVTRIGDNPFACCFSLTSIVVNSSNTTYDSRKNCNAIIETATNSLIVGCKNTIILNSVTSIGDCAFYGCSALTSVMIPNSVTSIGYRAFYGCSLTSLVIPNSVTSIGGGFLGCEFTTPVYNAHCFACLPASFSGAYTIPDGIKQIASDAFWQCKKLTSVTIPNSVESIGSWAFAYCSSLTSITMPNSVTSIEGHTFQDCSALTSITIPHSVTSIGNEAFHGCSGLMSIISLADTPPTTMTTAFSSVNKTIPVYVPCGQVDVYQSSIGWSQFTNIQSVTYSIEAYSSNSRLGIVRVDDDSLCEVQISATANEGYHFTQWSDGNTANPRSLVLTQDTVLVAAFAINQYQLNVSSNNPEAGMVNGTGLYDHGTSAKISATANEGYHFTQWSDGNTETPRTLVLTQDTNLTAEFVCNTYMLTIRSNGNGSVIGSGTYNQGEVVTISATPNAGYHFTQWSDGNTDNPRTIVLTQDTTLSAEFAINTYTLTTKSNGNGSVIGNGIYNHGETVNISATADIGYHFVRWSDGNTDNPRSLVLTKDTELTAIFAKNIYSVNVSYNEKEGNVAGNTSAEYLESATITATPNIGYHFTQWADGNTDNPRTIVLTQDTTLTAEFAINTYTLTIKSNLQGNIIGNGIYNHGETVILSATADIGYHFVRWSDGFTDNPRTIVLTQDTVLTAEFAQSFSGQCGENLYWAYNESEQSLSISGTGDMYNYTTTTQPWILFKEKIKTVYTTNTVTSFGTSAFEGAIRLAEVYIGSAFETIEDRVFAGCTRLRNIHCYPTYPPIIFTSSFERYDANLYIPCDYLEDYTFDPIWNKFTNIQCSGAEKEEVENNGVEVDPSSTSVTMIWPTEEDANTYTIEIRKDGAIFCRLTFNTEGQLLNLSFAPARNGKKHAVQYATKTANGLRFTVTGLNESTHYTYNLKAKDKAEKALQSYSGEFTTKSSNISSGVENTDTQHVTSDTRKIIRDNQLIILRDGVEYNAMGVRL